MNLMQSKLPRRLSRWARGAAIGALLGLAAGMSAWAAGGGGGGAGGGGEDGDAASVKYQQGVEAIMAGRWSDAIRLLEEHVRRARDDADGHNWLGFAYRKSGNLPSAFKHYERALALVPGHLGAHEYIGEAYLKAGQPAQAEVHLRELARLCGNCEQFVDLQQALADYRAGRPLAESTKP